MSHAIFIVLLIGVYVPLAMTVLPAVAEGSLVQPWRAMLRRIGLPDLSAQDGEPSPTQPENANVLEIAIPVIALTLLLMVLQ